MRVHRRRHRRSTDAPGCESSKQKVCASGKKERELGRFVDEEAPGTRWMLGLLCKPSADKDGCGCSARGAARVGSTKKLSPLRDSLCLLATGFGFWEHTQYILSSSMAKTRAPAGALGRRRLDRRVRKDRCAADGSLGCGIAWLTARTGSRSECRPHPSQGTPSPPTPARA